MPTIPVIHLQGAMVPPELSEDVLVVTSSLAVRDALLRQGLLVVYAHPGSPPPDLPGGRAVSLARGTLFVDEGRVDTEVGAAVLAPQQQVLAEVLSDGEWHEADELEERIYDRPGPRSRLHSALARLRRCLGGCVDSAYGGGWRLRVVGARRPAPTLLDLLDSDRPVSVATLARQLGCAPGAVRARVHRLRRSGVQVGRVREGYVLRDELGSVRQAIADAVRAHGVVNLWGPIGVGKSTLLRELGGDRVVRLDGLDPETARRRVARLAERGTSTIWLDGVDRSTAPVPGEVGRPIVVASRAPIEGYPQVALLPWTAERLERAFPERDTSAWDGLPMGALRDEEIRARLPDEPALDIAAREPSGFHAALLDGAADALVAQGLLVGGIEVRLVGPVLRALRSEFTDEDWVRLGERMVRRLREGFNRQQLKPDSGPARDGLALLETLEARGLPTTELVLVLNDGEVLRDPSRLRLAAAVPSEHRPDLLYRLWLRGEGDATAYQAIAEARAPDRYDFMVQLGYELFVHDPDEARRLFAEVGAWLDAAGDEADVWVRNEWLTSLALRRPLEVEPEDLIEQLKALEGARFGQPVPKLQWARVNCLWALGVTALIRDRHDMAIQAFEEVVLRLGPGAVLHGGLELLKAYARRGDWALADAHYATLESVPLNEHWEQYRAMVYALVLLGQGRVDRARAVCEGIDPDHPRYGFAPRLIGVLRGGPVPDAPDRGVLLEVAHAVSTGDLSTLRALPTAIDHSGAQLVRIVEVCAAA